MLEFLGFITLIAIIFGISFGAALQGFLKFVLITACLILALCIIIKLLESKKGAIFVLIASIIAVAMGVFMAFNHDFYESRMSTCFTYQNPTAYENCASVASTTENEKTNRGWGYIVVGGGLALWSFYAYSKLLEQETPRKH